MDPMTGKDWSLIKDARGITGVASSSEQAPVKQDFTDYPQDSPEFKYFEGKTKYSDWQFDYRQIQTAARQQAPGQAPATSQTPSTNPVPVSIPMPTTSASQQ
jgi:hypothetical protein